MARPDGVHCAYNPEAMRSSLDAQGNAGEQVALFTAENAARTYAMDHGWLGYVWWPFGMSLAEAIAAAQKAPAERRERQRGPRAGVLDEGTGKVVTE